MGGHADIRTTTIYAPGGDVRDSRCPREELAPGGLRVRAIRRELERTRAKITTAILTSLTEGRAAMIRALLLTLAVVLFFAGSAAAACAWVLWDIQVPPNGQTIFTADSSHETKTACDQLAVEKASRPWNRPSPVMKDFVRFVCFPDTVDPRRPKGSER
jgi:hypothetical protein